ncbi:MAG: TldD/PmbA family protein [Leptospiraceae bacterium]|nr:TldD/PmbA family protein [Leptospiraceae bacterium]
MNTQQAIEFLANEATKKGITQFDIVGYDTFGERVEVYSGRIESSELMRSAAVSVRVFVQNRPGSAFTERFTPEALRQCLADACAHAELTDATEIVLPTKPEEQVESFDLESEEFEKTNFATLCDFALKIETELRQADPHISNVPYCGASRNSTTAYFWNSNGIFYQQKEQIFGAYCAAVATENGQNKFGYAGNSRVRFSELKSLPLVKKAAERAVAKLGASPIKSGHYTVLFGHEISGQIFALYQQVFFAEMAQKGLSRLAGLVGSRIASEVLSVAAIARDPGLRGSCALDGEGVLTQDVLVVENGIFQRFLYNLESAAREHTRPTGHGVRGISGKAGTTFHNLVVPPGTKTRSELLSAGEILVIDKLEGASGCSAVSGEFSIGAQGFLYRNGNMVQPVDRITLNSNFFDILKNLEAVSSEYNDQFSSVRVPDLLVGGIAVAG